MIGAGLGGALPGADRRALSGNMSRRMDRHQAGSSGQNAWQQFRTNNNVTLTAASGRFTRNNLSCREAKCRKSGAGEANLLLAISILLLYNSVYERLTVKGAFCAGEPYLSSFCKILDSGIRGER